MVIVVGAGPAGCIAAEALASSGREVVLVERAPGRVKPCGGGLPQRAVEFLGLPESIIERRVTSLAMHGRGGRVVVCRMSPGRYVAMLRREALDGWLLERAVAAGAQLVRGTFLGLTVERDRVRADVRMGGRRQAIEGHALLGADGVGSRVRQAIGADDPPLLSSRQERIAIAPEGPLADAAHFWFDGSVISSGYGWAFPRKDHIAVGVGTYSHRAASLGQAMDILKRRISPAREPEVLLREAHRLPAARVRRRVADRVMLLGDAAGYVAPFTAEGILYAVWSARLAVEVLLENWRRPYEMHLRDYQARWDRSHRFSWGVMALLERVFGQTDRGREALLDYLSDEPVGRTLADAWSSRLLRPSRELSLLRTPVQIALCLLRRLWTEAP